jgi:hypothetical protein
MYSIIDSVLARMFPWEIITACGCRVDPEVNINAARSDDLVEHAGNR